jgi:enoyl-CoA hydratase
MSQVSRTVQLDVDDGLATIRLDRDHGNAINAELLQDLLTAYQDVAADPGTRGVLLTSSGKLFSPGLDLRELLELDRARMQRFMARLTACLVVMYTCPKPVVAAIRGHALAGGCVLALTADRRCLREGAMIGLNEVRVGVPLPFGVALILREAARSSRTEEVALLGRNYSGAEAVEVGLAHEVLPEDGFEERCRERLAELTTRDPKAYATTKRYLRSQTVERIRASDFPLLEEFLDCWFSDATRTRIASIVAELDSKK